MVKGGKPLLQMDQDHQIAHEQQFKQDAHPSVLECNMGTGKPTVFPKWIRQVWVQCCILTHHCTPCTCPAVLQVLMGLLLSLLFQF